MVEYDLSHFEAAYSLVRDMLDKAEREKVFLKKISHLIANPVSDRDLPKIADIIISEAISVGLKLSSVAVLTALSCLYEAIGRDFIRPSRLLLKPKIKYDAKHAYNAISDLRNIELFAASNCISEEKYALCTCDKGIALLWCGLNPNNFNLRDGKLIFNMSINKTLFPRLQEGDLDKFKVRLNG